MVSSNCQQQNSKHLRGCLIPATWSSQQQADINSHFRFFVILSVLSSQKKSQVLQCLPGSSISRASTTSLSYLCPKLLSQIYKDLSKKKKTNHNWYFSRYIHYRNLGDLHEKERRELQENQVRELEYSFTIVNVEEKKTDLHMIFHRYHHAIPPTWINLRKFHIHILWLIPGQTHCGNIPRHLFAIWPLGGSANNSILSLTMNTMG